MKREHLCEINRYMLENAGDAAHDAQHIYRVLNQALNLAKNYILNEDVLIASCLLHDIGRPAQFADPMLCHAEIGSEMAYRFLVKLGWDETLCEQVRHCVLTHRFRNDEQPQTIEAKILFDADKLDVIGALGIARTLQYEGKMNLPIEEFLTEYDRKLIKLYDRFYTVEAARLAANRKEILERFREELQDQLDTHYAQNLLKPALDEA